LDVLTPFPETILFAATALSIEITLLSLRSYPEYFESDARSVHGREEQLIVKFKSVYASLVMVETKGIEVNDKDTNTVST
jgi:hypothetical protein